MPSLRAKIKRRLSIKDTPEPDFSADEADEETMTHMTKEIEEAEKHGYDAGKPGSFINRLIERGNRKTDEQVRREGEKK